MTADALVVTIGVELRRGLRLSALISSACILETAILETAKREEHEN